MMNNPAMNMAPLLAMAKGGPGVPAPSAPAAPALNLPVPAPKPGLTPMPPDGPGVPGPGPVGQPLSFNVHIEAMPDEIQAAIQLLNKSGMQNLAGMLQKALASKAPQAAPNDADALASEIQAQGHNPHGGMTVA